MTQITTQEQRLDFLIRYLLIEKEEYRDIEIPADKQEKQHLLRSLMNVRPPVPARAEFLKIQDDYLQERIEKCGVTKLEDLTPVQPGIYLWQGDITTLAADAIVNAANSLMLGCFVPCHGCIDNAIHTYAGIQLRLECAKLMAAHGLQSIAFCCISTGEFHFPGELAAKIAIQTVKTWQQQNPNQIEVIFNVFKDSDYKIYKHLLR